MNNLYLHGGMVFLNMGEHICSTCLLLLQPLFVHISCKLDIHLQGQHHDRFSDIQNIPILQILFIFRREISLSRTFSALYRHGV